MLFFLKILPQRHREKNISPGTPVTSPGATPVPSSGAIPVEHPEGARFNRTGGAGGTGPD